MNTYTAEMVTLELKPGEFELLHMAVGFTAGARPLLRNRFLILANRINEGNPQARKYTVEEDVDNADPS